MMVVEEVENRTYYFVFNNRIGCTWFKRNERNRNIIVNNKELTTFLVSRLGLQGSGKYRIRIKGEAIATEYGYRYKILNSID